MSSAADYIEQLARFASQLEPRDLPAEVLERTKWILADCIGVTAAGMQQPEMRELAALHLKTCAPGEAAVIGINAKANAMGAAFLNGIAGTWLELDEGNTLSKGHPGIQLVPAAFAYAQENTVSGSELLAAIAVGYEVSSRINRAGRIRPSVHPHGTFGVIGAALAVARLRHLRTDRFATLINVAAALPVAASYRTLDEGATVRNVFSGHSAQMGMTAVSLVEAGFSGERDGVGRTYGEIIGEAFDPAIALADLGSTWMVAHGYFKLHPTARSVHPAIDAVEEALRSAGPAVIAPDQVARIDVRTYGLAAAKSQKDVRTAFGAKFSIPFAVATFIYHGRGTLECFDDAAVANPAIRQLTQLVMLSEDPAMTSAYPGKQPCEVSISLKDGRVYKGTCEIVRGEPGKPNTIDEVRQKFVDLTARIWGESEAASLFSDCMRMERIADVAGWSRAYAF